MDEFRRVVVRCLPLLIVVGVAIVLLFGSKPYGDYSYKAYVRFVHMSSQACDLSRPIYCLGTNELPTRSQVVLWQGYVLWNSCYQYGSPLACDQLGD
jgi:hypothetical protein